MQKNPLVSIVIVSEKINDFLKESLPKYKDLNYSPFEVLLFLTEPLQKEEEQFYKKICPNLCIFSNPELKNNPAQKRDLVIKYGKGEIYAFIDDDAYPTPSWLKEAVTSFASDNAIVAVGGPGITPNGASVLEKSSGWVSASPLGGFGSTHRFIPTRTMLVDDFPSCNLLVKKEPFVKINGFDSNFYPGEDTKLCLELTKDGVSKILYNPKAVVYHHKRPLFKKHLTQVGRFGLHRGHFARILPRTSRRLIYFLPSVFSTGLIFGFFFLLINFRFGILVLLGGLGLYGILLLVNSLWVYAKSRNFVIALLTILGVFLTHFWYGLRFILGLFKERMKDTYGRA